MLTKNRIVMSAAGFVTLAASLAGAASAADLRRARTEAALVTSATGVPAVQLDFAAQLVNGLPDLSGLDVVVGWGEVGGVEPQPFRILIPAGCFVAGRGFRVEDFRACGVQAALSSSRGGLPVSIQNFEARVVSSDDGTHRFDIVARFTPPSPIIPPDPVLGAVGGTAVRVGIGSESSMVFPLRTETVSGISPDPF